MTDDFIKILAPILTGIAGITAAFQWVQMRTRNKVKTDLDILEALLKAQSEQKELQPEAKTVIKHIRKKINAKYAQKPAGARDFDRSNILWGCLILYSDSLWIRFIVNTARYETVTFDYWCVDMILLALLLLVAGGWLLLDGIVGKKIPADSPSITENAPIESFEPGSE